MPAANYKKTSPYTDTEVYSFFLDVANIPDIPKDPSDVQYKIDNIYQHRPDLLAYDLYGVPGLWWVFYQRNPNTLTKPPLDFVMNTNIYIPKLSTLRSVLGF